MQEKKGIGWTLMNKLELIWWQVALFDPLCALFERKAYGILASTSKLGKRITCSRYYYVASLVATWITPMKSLQILKWASQLLGFAELHVSLPTHLGPPYVGTETDWRDLSCRSWYNFLIFILRHWYILALKGSTTQSVVTVRRLGERTGRI